MTLKRAGWQRLSCEECGADLANEIGQLRWEGKALSESPVMSHLESCPRCAGQAVHLIDLTTAPDVQRLHEAQIDPARAPARLEGLRALWQVHLAACNRLEDLRGAAIALNVIGLIRRCARAPDEAAEVQRRAVETAEEAGDPWSQAMALAAEGGLALEAGRSAEALDRLTRALQCAAALRDSQAEIRVRLLLGDAWRARRNLQRAGHQYQEAIREAEATAYAWALGTARERLSSLTAEALWQAVGEEWQRLGTTLRVGIAQMRAWFDIWPPGLQPQPAEVPQRYRRGGVEAWTLRIPEEGIGGVEVGLRVASPSGKRADVTLTLVEQPAGRPVYGAQVSIQDQAGLAVDLQPCTTGPDGAIAFQLWPGTYSIAIAHGGRRRDLALEVVTGSLGGDVR